MHRLHPLLARQLRRHLPPDATVPEALRPLLEAVSDSYAQADEDLQAIERSLDTVSREMLDRFARLEAQKVTQAALAAERARAEEAALLASVQLAAMRALSAEALLPGVLYVIADQVNAVAARLTVPKGDGWQVAHAWHAGDAPPEAVTWSGDGEAPTDVPLAAPSGFVQQQLVVEGPPEDEGRLEFLSAPVDAGRLTGELARVIARQLASALRERRTARALDAQVALLTAIASGTPDAITAKDRHGRYVLCNPAAARLFGHEVRDILGRTDAELLDAETAALVMDEDRAVIASGETATCERRWRFGDAERETRDLLVRRVPLRDPVRGVTGVAVLAADRTDAVAMEARLRHAQKMEALGVMAGGVAHDFNNLLTVISGNASLLAAEAPVSPNVADSIREIRIAVDRAAAVVRHLQTFARGRVTRPALVDLVEFVREREPVLARLLGESVSLHLATGDHPLAVRVDPALLDQVLANLVMNARRALPEGGTVWVALEARSLEASQAEPIGVSPGPFAALHVTDTGIGMDEATRARVFEPFFTTKAPGEGSGLGLSFVYGAVRQAGGATRVESAPGRGSTFTILLPHARASASGDPPVTPASPGTGEGRWTTPTAPDVAPGATGVRRSILLVEDDDAVRTIAHAVLVRAGFRVLEARNGEEALQRVAEATDVAIDLLLSDVMMPRMGGAALAARLRERLPSLPILLTSGYTDDEVARARLEAAGFHFLPKPFTVDGLLAGVRAVLDQAARERALGRTAPA